MAKITSISPTGVWQDLHKYEVTMDDGATGTAFAKTVPPWYSVGDEVEYTLNAKGGMKISKDVAGYTQAPASGGTQPKAYSAASFGNKDEQIARSVAFKGAIDLAVSGKIGLKDIITFVKTHTPIILGIEPQGESYKEHFADENPF